MLFFSFSGAFFCGPDCAFSCAFFSFPCAFFSFSGAFFCGPDCAFSCAFFHFLVFFFIFWCFFFHFLVLFFSFSGAFFCGPDCAFFFISLCFFFHFLVLFFHFLVLFFIFLCFFFPLGEHSPSLSSRTLCFLVLFFVVPLVLFLASALAVHLLGNHFAFGKSTIGTTKKSTRK